MESDLQDFISRKVSTKLPFMPYHTSKEYKPRQNIKNIKRNHKSGTSIKNITSPTIEEEYFEMNQLKVKNSQAVLAKFLLQFPVKQQINKRIIYKTLCSPAKEVDQEQKQNLKKVKISHFKLESLKQIPDSDIQTKQLQQKIKFFNQSSLLKENNLLSPVAKNQNQNQTQYLLINNNSIIQDNKQNIEESCKELLNDEQIHTENQNQNINEEEKQQNQELLIESQIEKPDQNQEIDKIQVNELIQQHDHSLFMQSNIEAQTSYKQQFQDLEKIKEMQYNPYYINSSYYSKSNLKCPLTTMQTDFCAKELEKHQSSPKIKNKTIKSIVQMTSYQSQFINWGEHQISKIKNINEKTFLQLPLKGESSYKTSFQIPKIIERTESCRVADTQIFSSVSFNDRKLTKK